MTYKYEDLVVIPKELLDNLHLFGSSNATYLRSKAKPLLPIVEDIFDQIDSCLAQNEEDVKISGNATYFLRTQMDYTKQEFITKGIEL